MEKERFLHVKDLKHHYKSEQVESHVLKGVNFSMMEKEFVTILGPSGCGKTTFLNLLGGLEKPVSGSIKVRSQEISSLSPEGMNQYRRSQTAFIFQFYNLFSTLTASENVAAGIEILNLSKKEIKERSEHYLEVVGLGKKKNCLPSHLSGGEQQRVAIARALAKQAPLILADEPTGNLDQETGASIMKLFSDINTKNDATILMITHDMSVARNATRMVKMVNGMLQEGAV